MLPLGNLYLYKVAVLKVDLAVSLNTNCRLEVFNLILSNEDEKLDGTGAIIKTLDVSAVKTPT